MKKLLVLFALPLLLVSCGKADKQRESSYPEMNATIEPLALTKNAESAIGKFSGTIKTTNGALIGMAADLNEKVSGTVTYSVAPDRTVSTTDEQPNKTFKPFQLGFPQLVAAEVEQTQQVINEGQPNEFTITWFWSVQYYVNPLEIVREGVTAFTFPAAPSVVWMWYRYADWTFNEEQWLTKLHYVEKIRCFKDGQEAVYVADTVGTYTYNYR